MRNLRLVALLLLFVGTASPAATTTALDPLVSAVLSHRAQLDPARRQERKAHHALGRATRELAAATSSLAGDLDVVALAIKALKRIGRGHSDLRTVASASLADLTALARGDRERLAIWAGRMPTSEAEESLAAGLAEADRLYLKADAKRDEVARARLYARGCEAIQATRAELAIPGDPPVMPAFSIPDVNPASVTYGQEVSPRDFEDKISAWYFGKAG